MINMNRNTAWNLKPIPIGTVRGEVLGLLTPGEDVAAAFRSMRDQLIFTNKRIISVDVQGITGSRKSYSSLPYSKIQFFSIQSPGFAELVPDSELELMFSNGFIATFEFRGNVDIGAIGRIISQYVLDK